MNEEEDKLLKIINIIRTKGVDLAVQECDTPSQVFSALLNISRILIETDWIASAKTEVKRYEDIKDILSKYHNLLKLASSNVEIESRLRNKQRPN